MRIQARVPQRLPLTKGARGCWDIKTGKLRERTFSKEKKTDNKPQFRIRLAPNPVPISESFQGMLIWFLVLMNSRGASKRVLDRAAACAETTTLIGRLVKGKVVSKKGILEI